MIYLFVDFKSKTVTCKNKWNIYVFFARWVWKLYFWNLWQNAGKVSRNKLFILNWLMIWGTLISILHKQYCKLYLLKVQLARVLGRTRYKWWHYIITRTWYRSRFIYKDRGINGIIVFLIDQPKNTQVVITRVLQVWTGKWCKTPGILLKLTHSYQRQCVIHHNCHPEITLLQWTHNGD